MLAYCLADFFNLKLWPSGREPSYPDIRDGLDALVTACVQAVQAQHPRHDEVLVRLYGGWHEDRLETRVVIRELVAAAIPAIPRTGARLRLEIADAPLWDRSLRMIRTVRKTPFETVNGVFFDTPALCINPASCAVDGLRQWWRGHCPTNQCSVRLADIGWTRRQKMVDTLMTADALTALHHGMCDVLAIVSDDDDLIPALLATSVLGKRTVHLRRNPPTTAYYAQLLEHQGVVTYTW